MKNQTSRSAQPSLGSRELRFMWFPSCPHAVIGSGWLQLGENCHLMFEESKADRPAQNCVQNPHGDLPLLEDCPPLFQSRRLTTL